MPKLHELLAVEANLKGQADTTRKDLMNTFDKKKHHFSEVITTFKPSTEGIPDKVESQLGLQTTVKKEIAWISEKLVAALDVAYQVEIANTLARADVQLEDGTVILKSLPATSLLQLEKRLKEIQEFVMTIPTLDPAKSFEPDPAKGEGIFKARDVEKPRTEKKFEYVVMVQPTKEHPAQVKELVVDRPVGVVLQQEWSSLITVAEKGDMLDRVEILTRAIKKARSKANEQDIDVKENKIATKLLNFVFTGAK
jgi:hypothetical protein